MKSFRAHYSDFGQILPCTAITQRRILTDMLKALIRAEADVSNILEIVGANKRTGEQFHSTPTVTSSLPSVAKRTIKSYTPGDKADGSGCFGCGDPHPWAKKINGKWVIMCPKKDQPSVIKRAKLAISQLQSRRKRKIREAQKRRNVNSLTPKSVPAGTKLVLFGRYVHNIYVGIVQYFLRKTKTQRAKIYLPTQRTNWRISYDIN